MKTEIWIDPLSLINMEDLNDILDNTREARGEKGVACDIAYEVKKLNKDGTLIIEATHQVEEL